MWAESIEQLHEKFRELRQAGWDSFVYDDSAHFEAVRHLYENLTWEMVQGLGTLVLQMIENQHYVARKVPTLEGRVYSQAHATMMEKIEEASGEEITTIPQFYHLVRDVIQQLHGYAKMLKQDMQRNYMRFLHPRPDRRYRQINITLRDIIEAFERIEQKNDFLNRLVGGETADLSIRRIESNTDEFSDLIDDDMFSEEEKALLRKMVDED